MSPAGEDEIRLQMAHWTDELLKCHKKGQRVVFNRNDKRAGVLYLIAVASAYQDDPVEFREMAGGA